MTELVARPSRRAVAGLLLAAAAPCVVRAQTAPSGRLVFEVWRNGQKIGAHQVSFRGGADDLQVETDARMLIKLGPISVFNYRFTSQEHWRGGRFVGMDSHTTTNGKVEQLRAQRTAAGVTLDLGARTVVAPADAAPLSHWNPKAFGATLFNPQTGEILRETVRRGEDPAFALPGGRTIRATRYTLAGTAEITDWYDSAGIWTGLRGKAKDGSDIEYRRA